MIALTTMLLNKIISLHCRRCIKKRACSWIFIV